MKTINHTQAQTIRTLSFSLLISLASGLATAQTGDCTMNMQQALGLDDAQWSDVSRLVDANGMGNDAGTRARARAELAMMLTGEQLAQVLGNSGEREALLASVSSDIR